ncbi:MAG: hypothetical protein K0R54_2263 [Clostridiaceae bacterium]|jgi:hypothetical protein|nr:hypothetical protein [Clostridiaceae bacterium]
METIIGNYKEIIIEDGDISKEQLLQMLRLDNYIPDNYKNEDGFEKIANKILIKTTKAKEMSEKFERRLKLFNQGHSISEIAVMEGVIYQTLKYWFVANGLFKSENKRGRPVGSRTTKSQRTA